MTAEGNPVLIALLVIVAGALVVLLSPFVLELLVWLRRLLGRRDPRATASTKERAR